ncbi:MAG: recombinase family protein [Oscillospiraceae bacterium]|nr:recombinase family protein [Oscillospiraceae bacterium]
MATVTVIQPITATETNKLRVAAYCRVSSSSEDQLNSYQAQLTYYSHRFEDSTTEELVDLYADEGITGTREDKRDEFQRLMKDCRRGKIDRIYTKSISRFARNTRDCLKNIRELKSLGITIFFEKEGIDTANVTDEMMITIMGGLAQEESVSISQNLRWGFEKKMQNGTFILPTAPYGYRMENQKLVICEDEAKIVRFIFSAYLAGYGIHAIKDMLNESEETRLNHSEWKYVSVRYILRNEKYTGNSLWHKFCMTDTLPYRKITNRGQKAQYYVTGTHPAIITEEEFQKVQALMEIRKAEKTEIDSPFKKKLFCKECGTVFRIKHTNGKVYWVCRTHDEKAELCSVPQIAEKQIISAFIAMHNKLLQHHKEILLPLQSALQDLKLRKFSGNLRVMDIHKDIAKLREQVHVLSRLKTKGFLDEAKYQEQTTELNAKINRLQQELKRMTRSDEEDETLDQIEMLTDLFEKREHLMTEFEPDIFESIVGRIVVKSRNDLEFHLIGGLKFTEMI